MAHSNSGLLARYYARYGTADMLTDSPVLPTSNGSHRIRRLLLVGALNLGSMQPVLSHVRGEEMGLRHIPAGSGQDIARLEIAHSIFLCEAHQFLTGNLSFQDNLLFTLLRLEED